MAPRRKTEETVEDPRTVKVVHEDGREYMVTPEVAGVLERNEGFEIIGSPSGRNRDAKADTAKAVDQATAPLLERIEQLEGELAAAKADTAKAPTTPPKGDKPADTAKEA